MRRGWARTLACARIELISAETFARTSGGNSLSRSSSANSSCHEAGSSPSGSTTALDDGSALSTPSGLPPGLRRLESEADDDNLASILGVASGWIAMLEATSDAIERSTPLARLALEAQEHKSNGQRGGG